MRMSEFSAEVEYDLWALDQALSRVVRAVQTAPVVMRHHKDDLDIIADKMACLMYDLEDR